MSGLFKRDKKSNKNKLKWEIEYEDTVYKVYDWNKKLTGYFFPKYNLAQEEDDNRDGNNNNVPEQQQQEQEEQDEIIEKMNKLHEKVTGGNIMVPMLRLDLLDIEEKRIDLDYTIATLEQNLQRAKKWKQWLEQNHIDFRIVGNAVYTAREDRNMLSIVLGINSDITLGEKEIGMTLTPLLDKLHEDGML
jgi:hypothetical protein